uniref:hypothetical protein n=1 Tax=Actinoplanes sp. CA-084688 TaxID=3239901 RepID=UPI003F4996BB
MTFHFTIYSGEGAVPARLRDLLFTQGHEGPVPMTQSCVPTSPGPRRRRGQVVVLIIILLLAMVYSLALLWLEVSAELTITVLSTVTAVTVQLFRIARPDAAVSGSQ